MVKRLANDALFISAPRWAENRFLAAGCKARGVVSPTRRGGVLGVLVVAPPTFISQMEAAFKV